MVEEGDRSEIGSSDQVNGFPNSFPSPRRRSSSRNNSPRSFSFLSPTSFDTQFPSSSCFLTIHRFFRRKGVRTWWRRRAKALVIVSAVLACFLMMNWLLLSRIQDPIRGIEFRTLKANSSTYSNQANPKWHGKGKRPHKTIYARLLAKASHALAEGQNKPEPKDLWVEPFVAASSWRPCSDQLKWKPNEGKNGYIVISANGGLNQQRVAVCNAVAVARLLNATLVIPKFLYSSVWRDVSQFDDIYQEKHFIEYLSSDIRIVKELPLELQSLDLEAIGSVVTDADIIKEAKPSFYIKHILPLLLRNRVIHFVGFGNRLSADPLPFNLQRLRCRCNFHALKFVPKIQETGALLLRRMRQNTLFSGPLDRYLVGPSGEPKEKIGNEVEKIRYLALHLRFEIDMVAHSLCEFGGGEAEKQELESYREIHFPVLSQLKKTKKLPSSEELRGEGLCPLMPEETALMLAGLGFNRKTRVFLAGAQIYGGHSRLASLITLYPNLVTKEGLLSSSEIQPFLNYSSQLAALDFIVCTASDAFAMTDPGSQLSSLVSGYRVYYGGGKMPTIRPNKRRLADIFIKNNTIEWKVFQDRIMKGFRQTKRIRTRPKGRSVYRYPRCKECMCHVTK
ncbi:O-fucosyltransferase 15-like [Impatiens glandulifera]|uniref:O-fucosyltransferase 15-like n=1 Tax=Impatiens glandulifera TaxID=253017 RepID=UPI001FB09B6B|nr:O-fucosyltransferase 15-like [Impatiens glandulifera]